MSTRTQQNSAPITMLPEHDGPRFDLGLTVGGRPMAPTGELPTGPGSVGAPSEPRAPISPAPPAPAAATSPGTK